MSHGTPHHENLVSEYGNLLADTLTFSRIAIIASLGYLSITSLHHHNFNFLLFWITIAWLTDVLDGIFARAGNSSEISWFGNNERKIDLLLAFVAHLYVLRLSYIHPYINYGLFALLVVAFIQMMRSDEKDIFLQMIYIATVYGYIIIRSIVIHQYMWIGTVLFLLILVIADRHEFAKRVKYFLSLGTRS